MFMSDISKIVRHMRTQSEHAMSNLGVGFPEQMVLMILSTCGPSNQEAIASRLDVDKGAITKTLAKLEEKGLVTRAVNPKNKREKIVEITPAADGVIQAMSEEREKMETGLFAGLTPQEIQQTCTLLARMAQNISEEEKE